MSTYKRYARAQRWSNLRAILTQSKDAVEKISRHLNLIKWFLGLIAGLIVIVSVSLLLISRRSPSTEKLVTPKDLSAVIEHGVSKALRDNPMHVTPIDRKVIAGAVTDGVRRAFGGYVPRGPVLPPTASRALTVTLMAGVLALGAALLLVIARLGSAILGEMTKSAKLAKVGIIVSEITLLAACASVGLTVWQDFWEGKGKSAAEAVNFTFVAKSMQSGQVFFSAGVIGPYVAGSSKELGSYKGLRRRVPDLSTQICNAKKILVKNSATVALIVGSYDERKLQGLAKARFDSNQSLAQLRADNVAKLLKEKGACNVNFKHLPVTITFVSAPRAVGAEARDKRNLAQDRQVWIYGLSGAMAPDELSTKR